MTELDWAAIGTGALLGALASALFFAGLAWGMRLALRRAHPTPVLLISAALRIGLLLVAGYWIAGQGATVLAGFVTGFLASRFCILLIVRRPALPESASWN